MIKKKALVMCVVYSTCGSVYSSSPSSHTNMSDSRKTGALNSSAESSVQNMSKFKSEVKAVKRDIKQKNALSQSLKESISAVLRDENSKDRKIVQQEMDMLLTFAVKNDAKDFVLCLLEENKKLNGGAGNVSGDYVRRLWHLAAKYGSVEVLKELSTLVAVDNQTIDQLYVRKAMFAAINHLPIRLQHESWARKKMLGKTSEEKSKLFKVLELLHGYDKENNLLQMLIDSNKSSELKKLLQYGPYMLQHNKEQTFVALNNAIGKLYSQNKSMRTKYRVLDAIESVERRAILTEMMSKAVEYAFENNILQHGDSEAEIMSKTSKIRNAKIIGNLAVGFRPVHTEVDNAAQNLSVQADNDTEHNTENSNNTTTFLNYIAEQKFASTDTKSDAIRDQRYDDMVRDAASRAGYINLNSGEQQNILKNIMSRVLREAEKMHNSDLASDAQEENPRFLEYKRCREQLKVFLKGAGEDLYPLLKLAVIRVVLEEGVRDVEAFKHIQLSETYKEDLLQIFAESEKEIIDQRSKHSLKKVNDFFGDSKRFILSSFVDLPAQSLGYRTALMFAAETIGHPKYSSDINDDKICDALKNPESFAALLALIPDKFRGAWLNQANENGWTSLMFAAKNNNMYGDAGAESEQSIQMNSKKHKKHNSVASGKSVAAALINPLISAGADPYVMNKNKETAFNIAIKANNHCAVEALRKYTSSCTQKYIADIAQGNQLTVEAMNQHAERIGNEMLATLKQCNKINVADKDLTPSSAQSIEHIAANSSQDVQSTKEYDESMDQSLLETVDRSNLSDDTSHSTMSKDQGLVEVAEGAEHIAQDNMSEPDVAGAISYNGDDKQFYTKIIRNIFEDEIALAKASASYSTALGYSLQQYNIAQTQSRERAKTHKASLYKLLSSLNKLCKTSKKNRYNETEGDGMVREYVQHAIQNRTDSEIDMLRNIISDNKNNMKNLQDVLANILYPAMSEDKHEKGDTVHAGPMVHPALESIQAAGESAVAVSAESGPILDSSSATMESAGSKSREEASQESSEELDGNEDNSAI